MTHENEEQLREILDQLQRYQDGALTPEEHQAFIEDLKKNPQKRQIIYETQLHVQSMRDLSQIADIQRQAFLMGDRESCDDCASGIRLRLWAGFKGLSWFAAAAAVIIIGFLFFRTETNPDPVSEPAGLAQVKYARRTIWSRENVDYLPGQSLAGGSYGLLAGTVCLEIPQKAVLTIAGPADFELVDDSTVIFNSGKLSARIIGENAITIKSPAMDVIDRGTMFGLEVKPDQQTLVSVFQGAVEVVPHRREVNPENLLIRRGSSVTSDSQEGVVERVSYDPSAFEELWPLVHGVEEMSDTIIFIPPGRISPLENFQNNSKLFLLAEKQNVVIDEWTPVDLRLPDRQINPKDRKAFMTNPNHHRNSFLFFLNPSDPAASGNQKIRGVIVFTDPIKGIFYSRENLQNSDAIFGIDEIAYNRAESCGLEVAETVEDRIGGKVKQPKQDYIRICPSRRKLYFELDGQSGPDQFRVILDAD